MIRTILLIRSLGSGGAERQLVEVAKGLDKTRFDVSVITFYDGGGLRTEIEGIDGVRLCSLHKKGRWDVVPFLWRLARLLANVQPRIVYSYMGVSNEIALIMGRLVGAKVVWGIRASNVDFSRYDWASVLTFRVGA